MYELHLVKVQCVTVKLLTIFHNKKMAKIFLRRNTVPSTNIGTLGKYEQRRL